MNVPKLRFPEFEGEWVLKKLGDVAEIVGGGTPDTFNETLWNGNIEWFTPTELKTKYVSYSNRKISLEGLKRSSAKILPVGTVLFSSRATVGDVSIALKECTTNQGFQSFIINNDCSNELIYYWLCCNKNEFVKRASGSTFLEISKNEITKIDIIIPSLPEQTKIASFLTAVDDKLTQLKKKKSLLEEYKKGVMQKIFSQELRFKDDNGEDFPEWEEKRLGKVAVEVKRGINENIDTDSLEVLTISAGLGFISQKERFNQVIAGQSLLKYTILRKGEFSYNRGASKKFQYGCFYLLSTYKEALVPNVYISFAFKVNNVPGFYNQLFSTGYANRQLRQFVSSSVRLDGLLNINKDDFFSINLPAPSYKEQTKIANFLSAIDEKINHCSKQIERMEEWKKGLLQQMFC